MSASTLPVLELEEQLRILARRVRRVIAERGAALDPSLGEIGFAVASHLHRLGELRQRDLVAGLAVEKAAVSRALTQLVDLGLVVRLPDPVDGRGHLVALTDEGRRRMDAVVDERRAVFVEKLADWSPAELAELTTLLARYNASLES